jgi:GNAT superfamily N-acetyltransferase
VAELVFTRYNADTARTIPDTVSLIHTDAYTGRASGEFDTDQAFMERFDAYTKKPTFTMIIGWQDGEPVGQTWGWPLDSKAGGAWWAGLLTEPEPGFTDEDGTRTFAFSEIMVRQAWTGHGIAHRLHNELLSGRPETRATLLVRPENTNAYRAYRKWGWHKAGELRPGWPDAPLMDVLVLSLPHQP